LAWIFIGFLALLAHALVAHWLLDNPRRDPEAGVLWRTAETYAALVHGLRATGVENFPATRRPGPLIVIANHTAGIDPLLIQTVIPFDLRWIMAADMRAPAMEWFWSFARVIFIDGTPGDVAAIREAIRHVKTGGVLGIFPEGGIERPPRTLRNFEPGVGLLIRRTGAPVLPVIIRDTPAVDTAWESLFRFSRSRLEFKPLIDYGDSGLSAEDIALDLRRRYAAWTGWPASPAR
jgi:1-acyl-sn-glycerol-3-phosphate acyltransferase